jgi:hypothetical protein
MTNKQKIETYTLIMDFMGTGPRMISPDRYSISKTPWYNTIQDTPEQCIESAALSDGLNYLSSWDAIMPVIEKIEKTNEATIEIHSKNLVVVSYNQTSHKYYTSNLLDNVCEGVLDFIKWYNKNK